MRTLLGQRYIRARLHGRYLVSSAKGGRLPGSDGRPRILVALAADYGNLGDVAITHAQMQLLRECFPERDVVPWLISRTLSDLKSWQAALGPDDIITTVGGGNMGDLYDDIECLRQLIIRRFPDHRIISFPQSVSFSRSIAGAIALRSAQRVYGSHRKLTLIARDPDSLHLLQSIFPTCHIEISPDVVLSLDQVRNDHVREGIVMTLRADAEQGLNENDRQSITTTLEKLGPITVRDTHVGSPELPLAEGLAQLKEIWLAFSSSKLVVTDRLHGMIFCVITGTPCLAIDSSNAKVSRFYRAWLQDIGHVRLLSTCDPVGVSECAESLLSVTPNLETTRSLRSEVIARLKSVVETSDSSDPHSWNSYVPPDGPCP